MSSKSPDTLGPIEWAVTQRQIDQYAAISGADDPLHVDPAFAATTRFGGTIAQGLLMFGQLAELLVRQAGGDGTAAPCLTLNIDFRGPVRPGQTVRLLGARLAQQGPTTYALTCTDSAAKPLLRGEGSVGRDSA